MSEPVNGGSSSPPKQPKEMSMEKRLLLAFLLMGAVLFTTPYLFKTVSPPPPPRKTAATAPTAETGPKDTAAASAPSPAVEAQPAAPEVQGAAPVAVAQKEERYTINTDVYQILFSNKGAVARSWQLKKYTTDGKPLELVNTASTVPLPFALVVKDQKL